MRRALRLATSALVAVALAAGLALVVPALLGYERYVIVSGSMAPAYEPGDLVYAEVVPVGTLRAGDVITFRPPGGDRLVTHRIAGIEQGPGGRPVFRTRGDANPVDDPWSFTLARGEQARVVAGIPLAGHAIAALGDRRVRMLLIGLPAACIALGALAGLWREAGAARAGAPA